MQPCKTGDQPYSDASPNGELSVAYHSAAQGSNPKHTIYLWFFQIIMLKWKLVLMLE